MASMRKYVEEKFIIGLDMAAEYKKKMGGEREKDEDDYSTKIDAIRAAL